LQSGPGRGRRRKAAAAAFLPPPLPTGDRGCVPPHDGSTVLQCKGWCRGTWTATHWSGPCPYVTASRTSARCCCWAKGEASKGTTTRGNEEEASKGAVCNGNAKGKARWEASKGTVGNGNNKGEVSKGAVGNGHR
jgi:hypothetical protein